MWEEDLTDGPTGEKLTRGDRPPDTFVGMGGATTNLTAVMLGFREYDPEAVQGAVLTLRELERQIELYR